MWQRRFTNKSDVVPRERAHTGEKPRAAGPRKNNLKILNNLKWRVGPSLCHGRRGERKKEGKKREEKRKGRPTHILAELAQPDWGQLEKVTAGDDLDPTERGLALPDRVADGGQGAEQVGTQHRYFVDQQYLYPCQSV